MRKILLASTAIVALSAGSAMASDITISGSFEFGYNDDSVNSAATALTNNDGTAYGVEQDVNIVMSTTTDSGLSMSMTMGLDETANDDVNATLSGDFGSLRFTSKDDDAVEALDVDVDGATSEEGTAGSDTPTYAGGFGGTGGTSVSYTLPTLMEGLTIAAASQNAGSDVDSTAMGASYAMTAGGASVKLAVASSSTGANATADVTQNHYGISISSGAFAVMAESNSRDDGTTADFSSTGIGGTYTMGAMKFGAYNRTASTGTATQDYSQTAWGVDYTIAAGLTASITQTSTDVSSTISTDRTRASLKMAF
jgi:hypothetical protein